MRRLLQVGTELLGGLRKGTRIARRTEPPTRAHDLGEPAHAGDNHRGFRGERLCGHQAKCLVRQGWDKQHIDVPEQLPQPLDRPEKVHGAASCPAFELRALRSGASNEKLDSWHGSLELLEGGLQYSDALLLVETPGVAKAWWARAPSARSTGPILGVDPIMNCAKSIRREPESLQASGDEVRNRDDLVQKLGRNGAAETTKSLSETCRVSHRITGVVDDLEPSHPPRRPCRQQDRIERRDEVRLKDRWA
jgi:hypothetical protein